MTWWDSVVTHQFIQHLNVDDSYNTFQPRSPFICHSSCCCESECNAEWISSCMSWLFFHMYSVLCNGMLCFVTHVMNKTKPRIPRDSLTSPQKPPADRKQKAFHLHVCTLSMSPRLQSLFHWTVLFWPLPVFDIQVKDCGWCSSTTDDGCCIGLS